MPVVDDLTLFLKRERHKRIPIKERETTEHLLLKVWRRKEQDKVI